MRVWKPPLAVHLAKLATVGLGAVLVLVALPAVLFWLVAQPLPTLCANTVVAESPSPDGRWKALVFERDCGATTRASLQVSVLPAGGALGDEGGNVFAGELAESGGGGAPLGMRWLGPDLLQLSHSPHLKVIRAEAAVGGVRIARAVES